MIISSGLMQVMKNQNKKQTKFFGEVEVGDIVEVKADLSKNLRWGGGSEIFTVHNLTKNTNRSDAPTYINSGLTKMVLEPVVHANEGEYQRGYQEAVGEIQSAYIGGYIEDYFKEDEYEGEV